LDLEALVATAVAANDRSVRDQRVVDTRERHQVSLELVQVDIQGTVKTQTGGDGADNLGNEAVQVVEAGAGNVQVAAANIVHGLIVDQESTVRVLDGAVGGENSVVRLDDSSRNTGRRVNTELQLGLLAILSRELFQQEGTETRASTSTERVENKETLQARASIYCGLVYRSWGRAPQGSPEVLKGRCIYAYQ
jgi:hypothetical protein